LVYLFVEAKTAGLSTKIEDYKTQEQAYQSSIDNIKSESAKLEKYIEENDKLKNRIAGLGDITVTEINRFESVLLVEFMHSLKPAGLWYKSLKIDSGSKKIDISGHAHDPSMIAHFIKSLISTKDKVPSEDDIRSRVSFEKIAIKNIRRSDFALQDFPKIENTHEFQLSFVYLLR